MARWVRALRLVGVGFYIAGSIVLGLFLGVWLDNKFGTRLLWVLGLILGIIIAAWGVYRMLLPLINNKHNGEDN
jgi:F0F1-type ATP synthase assembly protein I